MFKPIQPVLHEQLEKVAHSATQANLLFTVTQGYLSEQYSPEIARTCRIESNTEKHTLTITTPSKTIANDLLLRVGELTSLLRAAKTPITQILVR